MLSFRPLHFAAVDLPLGNKPFHQDESTPNAGAFKIDNGGVVGMYFANTPRCLEYLQNKGVLSTCSFPVAIGTKNNAK